MNAPSITPDGWSLYPIIGEMVAEQEKGAVGKTSRVLLKSPELTVAFISAFLLMRRACRHTETP